MMSLQASFPLEVLHQMKDIVQQGEDKMKLIPLPEMIYKEQVKEVESDLKSLFERFCHCQESGDQIQDEIRRQFRELDELELNAGQHIANASKSYHSQEVDVLQWTYNKLLTTIRSTLTQQASQHAVTDKARNTDTPGFQTERNEEFDNNTGPGRETAERNDFYRALTATPSLVGTEEYPGVIKKEHPSAVEKRRFGENKTDTAQKATTRKKQKKSPAIHEPSRDNFDKEAVISHEVDSQGDNKIDLISTDVSRDTNDGSSPSLQKNGNTSPRAVSPAVELSASSDGSQRNSRNMVLASFTAINANDASPKRAKSLNNPTGVKSPRLEGSNADRSTLHRRPLSTRGQLVQPKTHQNRPVSEP